MSDIFISYSSEDREIAEIFAEVLEEQGWDIWWDRDILGGESYEDIIEEELDNAKCVIVIWSLNSVFSDWVKNEAREAKKRDILIPVKIDNVEVPLRFRNLNDIKLIEWEGDLFHSEFDKLLRSVKNIIEYINDDDEDLDDFDEDLDDFDEDLDDFDEDIS